MGMSTDRVWSGGVGSVGGGGSGGALSGAAGNANYLVTY